MDDVSDGVSHLSSLNSGLTKGMFLYYVNIIDTIIACFLGILAIIFAYFVKY